MNQFNSRLYVMALCLVSLSVINLFAVGCAINKKGPDSQTKPARVNGQQKTMIGRSVQSYYSSLTYDTLSSIRNGSLNFSSFTIYYKSTGVGYNKQFFIINYGNILGDFTFSSVPNFKSEFNNMVEESGQMVDKFYKHEFTNMEVSAILDYISTPENRTYFFNGDEYEGLEIPYPHASISPPNKRFNFSLIFGEPQTGENYADWAIFKCVDEYPAPGTPLYGLYQMIENDFITQFEE